MARKKESILEVPMFLPWWVSVMVSAVAYLGMAVVISLFAGSSANAGIRGVLTGLSQLARSGQHRGGR